MHEISTSDAHPSITRVSDAKETAFSFATRKKSSKISISSLISKGLMKVLERRGWKLDEVCLSFIGYEGGKDHVTRQKKIVKDIVNKHGGILLGKGRASSTTGRSSTPPTSVTSFSIEAPSVTSLKPQRPGRSCCRFIAM
jgi:hypothetical protein